MLSLASFVIILYHSFIHFPVSSQLEYRAPFGVSVITITKTHSRTPLDQWIILYNRAEIKIKYNIYNYICTNYKGNTAFL
jgi:hypothetical protein